MRRPSQDRNHPRGMQTRLSARIPLASGFRSAGFVLKTNAGFIYSSHHRKNATGVRISNRKRFFCLVGMLSKSWSLVIRNCACPAAAVASSTSSSGSRLMAWRAPRLMCVTVPRICNRSRNWFTRFSAMGNRVRISRYSAINSSETMSCNLRCLNHKAKILALAENDWRLRKKLTMTLVSSTTGNRCLRSGILVSPLPLFPSILVHQLHCVIFLVAAFLRVSPHFTKELFVFPDFQLLTH